MGDLLGSLVQGSQKRTILCVIRVGCYTKNTYNPLQDLGSVRSTSLQLVSLLTIFFNVILLYRTLPIDFSIYAHKQTNKDPLRGTTRLTIFLSLITASHELSGGENPYL
jgi:hypothetical protein